MSNMKYIYNTYVSIVKTIILIGPLVHVDPTEMCGSGVRWRAVQVAGLIVPHKVELYTSHDFGIKEKLLVSSEGVAIDALFEFLVHLGFPSTRR
jgi:hypothetical protein